MTQFLHILQEYAINTYHKRRHGRLIGDLLVGHHVGLHVQGSARALADHHLVEVGRDGHRVRAYHLVTDVGLAIGFPSAI